MYYYGESDEETTSSKYAFYVTPDSLDGFMLGQHIIIEMDNGQSTEVTKTGIWLYTDFICKDGDKRYVWAKNAKKDKIEKRYVEIGETDEDYGDCQILSGLETDDYIAYPADYIKEGLETTTNQSDISVPDNDLTDGSDVDMYDDGTYDDTDTGDEDFVDYTDSGSFEEMYGITEEEMNSMTDEELEEFFNNFYADENNADADNTDTTDNTNADDAAEA